MAKFIVKGKLRGEVSKHQTVNAAVKSVIRDNQDCEAAGGFSDTCVYIQVDGKEYLVPLDINENNGTWQLDAWHKSVPKSVRKLVKEK
jgi:hypothetical protein